MAIVKILAARDVGRVMQSMHHDFARLWAETPAMATWMEQRAFKTKTGGSDAEMPVAVLPAGLASPGQNVMWLSQQTIGKIKAKHPEVLPENLPLVQAAVDGAEVFYQGENLWIGFTLDGENNWWAVGWKRIAGQMTGSKVYITTIHRSTPRQLRRAIKKLQRVKK